MAGAGGHPALEGLTVFERGWLSSNNLLVSAGSSMCSPVMK